MRSVVSFDDVLLVPKQNDISSRSKVDLSSRIGDTTLQLPILAANMPSVCETDMATALANSGGVGIIHRMCSIEEQAAMVQETQAPLKAAAIGIGDDWMQRASALLQSGVSLICLDVAHGHQDRVAYVAQQFLHLTGQMHPDNPPFLIVGNIATTEAAQFFLNNTRKTDHPRLLLKVGVGGGSVCTTRIKTGFGLPTLQSVFDVVKMVDAWDSGALVIADGGIKNSGDIVKCLAAGADLVMLGSLLAGTDEAPGHVLKDGQGNLVKSYAGAASHGAKKKHFGKAEYVEGAERFVPYKGPVRKVLKDLEDGIRSGMTYCGAKTLDELRAKAEFVRITTAGYRESLPHGVL